MRPVPVRASVTLAVLLALGGLALTAHAGSKAGVSAGVAGSDGSIHLKGVELEDQFGTPYSCAFPAAKPMVLLAADKKGYPALAPWIDAVRVRSRGQASIVGVADMRGVPGFLRGKIRRRFAAAEAYPVLLDWEGEVLTVLQPTKGLPNAYLISPEGCVLLHLSGEATDEKLGKLQAWLDDLVALKGTEDLQEQIAASAD